MIPLAAKWWKLGAGLILGFILCWPVASCSGRHEQSKLDRAAIDRANTAALQQKARADELAAQQRLTDTIAVSHQEQELRNAIASTPDSAPDAVRISLGCRRLLSAGATPASLPAVCRSAGGAQAGPSR